MSKLSLGLLVFAVIIAMTAPTEAQHPARGCKAPNAVCQTSARVFVISSFDPVGSAVLMEPGLLVTNRHVVANNSEAEIHFSDGTRRTARVIPTSYPGDLILLRLEGLAGSIPLTTASAEKNQQVYAIGADVGRNAVRVYIPGRVTAPPVASKALARVHHSARSQPGNSGGALVTREGKLVAFVSSGGDGRNEAIPVSAFEELKELSGPKHVLEHQRLGLAYRKCVEILDTAQSGVRLDTEAVDAIHTHCLATGNRQMFDDAGRVLGGQRHIEKSLDLFHRSLDQDPNGLNTRLSLAITLHVAQRYAEEIPHLEILMKAMPSDPQVLRLAIQAGKWSGNEGLANRAFQSLINHHPQLKSVAERFMKQTPPPRPGGVTPR